MEFIKRIEEPSMEDVHQEKNAAVITIAELNQTVRRLFHQHLAPMWIRGEVSNLTVYRSNGHVYFGLKDAQAQVSAVFFHGAGLFERYHLQQGSQIEAYGQVDLYEKGGNYQFIVSQIRPVGLGELYLKFEAMKERLRAEGLFDQDRKKPIPLLPKCIGLITSTQGAAIRDFMQILNRRFANMHLRIVNSPVQGPGTAARIARAVEYLNSTAACDVIVVTRGGGSMEDLWEFNEEVLARAVAASEIPVISAIGHERDFTICDFAADFRAPTPSAAAELVVHAKAEMMERFSNFGRRLQQSQQVYLQHLRLRLERAAACPLLQRPQDLIQRLSQRVDTAVALLARNLQWQSQKTRVQLEGLQGRIPVAMENYLEKKRERLRHHEAVFGALNPRRVLQRGYSIIVNNENQVIRRQEDAHTGEYLRAILAEGNLDLEVLESGDTEDGR